MPDRFTDEDRARLEALGQYVDCEVALRALAHIDYLEKALREIAERPTCERNPDGVDQAAATMQLIAREALKGEDEARSGSAGPPEMGVDEARVREWIEVWGPDNQDPGLLGALTRVLDRLQAYEGQQAVLDAAEAEKDEWQAMAEKCEARVGEYEEVLTLIATPKRPDGTYNRDREACEQLARAALDNEPYQTFTSGTFGPSKADLKGEDG